MAGSTKLPHEYLPPGFWDEVFKPRGPLGLLSGRTALDLVPGVSQGLSYVDAKQAAREGDTLGTALSGIGMIPGGGFFKGAKGAIRKIADEGEDVIVPLGKEKFRFPPGTDPQKALQEIWRNVVGPRAQGREEIIDNFPSELRADVPDETFDMGDMTHFSTPIRKDVQKGLDNSLIELATGLKAFGGDNPLARESAEESHAAVKALQSLIKHGYFTEFDLEEVQRIVSSASGPEDIEIMSFELSDLVSNILKRNKLKEIPKADVLPFPPKPSK